MCLSTVRKSVPVVPVIWCVLFVIHVKPGTCLKSAPWPRYWTIKKFHNHNANMLKGDMCLQNMHCIFHHCSWATYLTTQVQSSSVCSCPSGLWPFWSTGRERWPPWPITGTAWTSMKKRSLNPSFFPSFSMNIPIQVSYNLWCLAVSYYGDGKPSRVQKQTSCVGIPCLQTHGKSIVI